MKKHGWAWGISGAVCAGILSWAAYAQTSEIVTINALQWADKSMGWCQTLVAGAVAINLRDTGVAPVPGGVPTNVRYVEVMHADLANPSQPFCVRLGGDNTGPALQCDPVARPDRTTGYVGAEGRFRTMEIRSPSTPTGTPVWVATSAASNVTVCITVFW